MDEKYSDEMYFDRSVYIVLAIILVIICYCIYIYLFKNYDKTPIELINIVKNNANIDNVNYINGVPEIVYICWFGETISKNRLDGLKTLINNIKIPYLLITDDNVYDYQVSGEPYHKCFKYLSGNHKSDYIRSYMLHHYGGAYHDIKYRYSDWIGQWTDFNDNNIWIKTRPERYPSWVGYDIDNPSTKWIQSKYNELGTMGWVICRPRTPYTGELLDKINKTLNKHENNLTKNPSIKSGGYYSDKPFDKVYDPTNMYPMRWLELMGEHYHLLMYKYKDHLIFGLPDADEKYYK